MIHKAGEIIECVQRCELCGAVLLDRTNETAAIGVTPGYWLEGRWILVEPGMAVPLVDGELVEYAPSEYCRAPTEARVS